MGAMSLRDYLFHEEPGITLYCGDCREVLPYIRADVVITDPPYGIGFEYESHDDQRTKWYALMDSVLPLLRATAPFIVMPSCGIDRLGWWYANHAPTWVLAWYKGSPGHLSKIGFNDWESLLVWGRPHKQMHDHFQTRCGFAEPGHPCPKPIEWATWLISRAAPGRGSVVDPFAGSGTVLEAAKALGRRAIGIEIEPKYCEIAVKRLRQEVLI
jgi:DNA modification methylase